MKSKLKLIFLPIILLVLVGCRQSFERADRTITLVQDNMNSIVSIISDIQYQESLIQEQFEEMIQSPKALESFSNEEAIIYQNIQTRSDLLNQLDEKNQEFDQLKKEIQAQVERDELPSDTVDSLVDYIDQLSNHLSTYIEDYQTHLLHEKQEYQTLADPSVDYTEFFALFDRMEIITVNNQMNLENVVELIEPINTILINLKVQLANLQEAS